MLKQRQLKSLWHSKVFFPALALVAATTVLGLGTGAENRTRDENGGSLAVSPGRLRSNSSRPIGWVPDLVGTSTYVGPMASDEVVTLSLGFKVNDQLGLRQLQSELYDPASANFHRWLRPEEFGQRFGRSTNEVQRVANWLSEEGFQIDQVWPNNLAITFKGVASAVQLAFGVTMGRYLDSENGRLFFSNQQEPTLPADLAAIIQDLIGLNDAYPYKAGSSRSDVAHVAAKDSDSPNATFNNGKPFLAPHDLDVAYCINLEAADGTPIQGQGQRVAILVDSDVRDSDVLRFRSTFNLPQTIPVRFTAPGFVNPGITADVGEATLDVAQVSSVAPQAEIDLVIPPNSSPANFFAAQEFVVNSLGAKVVNESFGGCEKNTYSITEETLLRQAAMMGISYFVISGDEGAECNTRAGKKEMESGDAEIECPACFDSVTAVGGTAIQTDANSFDQDGNLIGASNEVAWNDAPGVRFGCNGERISKPGFHGSSGGGQSMIVLMPDYQVGAQGFPGGVPQGVGRFVPDVCADASQDAPSTVDFLDKKLRVTGGTSKASPFWAGLMALINQFKGGPQGSPNPELYRLGIQQYGMGGPLVFIDITTGNNSTGPRKPCVPVGVMGFQTTPGYDQVTGWGAPDLANLAKNYGVISGPVSPSSPVIESLSARLASAGQLDFSVVSMDDQGTITQAAINLLDSTGNPVPQTMPTPVRLQVRHSVEAAYTVSFTGLDAYPTAESAQFVLVAQPGQISKAEVANFSQADPGGPSLTLAAFNGKRMMVSGAGLTGDLRLEVNGKLVGHVTNDRQRTAIFEGKEEKLNLHTGVNRVRVERGPFFSNIFLLTL
jgi:subtilase family serine protease